MRVWHCSACVSRQASLKAVLGALSATGLQVDEQESPGRRGPCIFFFDQFDDAVCERVAELSGAGRERLLAIALQPCVLAAGAAWKLLTAGASDVYHWRDSGMVPTVSARLQRWNEIDELVSSSVVQSLLIGRCPEWLAVVRQVVEAACFTQAPVLITGESGTGKELAARLIHKLDPRRQRRELVILDCSTLVPELSGSEFFGHERGAFTGAVNARDGAFALADGGTLFLDEVGELPPDLQTQLLRAVQEHTYKKVGGNTWKTTDFRLVCATNRDLEADVANGKFRADLYYRLAGVCCHLPPLRERMSDVPVLAEHFLRELSLDGHSCGVDSPVMSWLLEREYKNNVRELRLVLTRMMHRHAGPGPLTVGDIPNNDRPCPSEQPRLWRDGVFVTAIRRALAEGAGIKEIGRAAEETAEQVAIEEEGSIQAAATRLGLSERALHLRRAARRERGSGTEGGKKTG